MADQINTPINYPVIAGGKIVVGGKVLFGNENQRPDEDNPATLKAIFTNEALSVPALNPQPLGSNGQFDQSVNGTLYGPDGAVYSVLILDRNGKELSYIPSFNLNDTAAATAASASAAAAAASQTAAEISEDNTDDLYTDFINRYFGAYTTNPAADAKGNPPSDGSLYFNTTGDIFYIWSNGVWASLTPADASSYLVTATGTTETKELGDWTSFIVKENVGQRTVSAGTDSLDAYNTPVRFSTAFGHGALQNQTAGTSNSAFGTYALRNTEGESSANNSAFGRYAMWENLTGFDNCAFGSSALQNNTEGKANTAIGRNAMLDNTTGRDNVAIGEGCMPRIKAAASNVAVGVNACQYTDEDGTGVADTNTGVGAGAMRFNRLGKNNIAIGAGAVEGYKQGDLAVFTTTVSGGVLATVTVVLGGFGYTSTPTLGVAGGGGTGVSLTANMVDDGTGNSTFKVDSVTINNAGTGYTSPPTVATIGGGLGDAGRDEAAAYNQSNNTGVGNYALSELREGDENVAVGRNAGKGIIDGASNIALGNDALTKSDSTAVVVIGRNSAQELTNLATSVFVGHNTAGASVADGVTGNTGVGYESLRDTAGNNNTALGSFAGRTITTGTGNTAIGQSCLLGGAGSNNTALGSIALEKVTTGFNNTGLGRQSLRLMQDGSDLDTEFNSTGVGYDSRVSGSNQVQLGNSSTTTYAYGAVQDRSDARDKVDLKPISDNLIAFFMDVEWKTYRLDYRDDYIVVNDNGSVTHLDKDGSKARLRPHVGAIAQQVEASMLKHGVDFAGLQHHSLSGGSDVYTIGYQEFIGIQGEIIQRQSKQIDSILLRLDKAGL